jgi:hypothetical protein
MKSAEKAALGLVAALGAGVAAVGVATQKTAEAGDKIAKTSRLVGMTAEAFQDLDYAAKMSGVTGLDSSLIKLHTVGDVKSGTGSLTTYLKDNDRQLLNQLKNVSSNEEAFNLLIDAIGKAPDEFSKAELAQVAFGNAGKDMILMANDGADSIHDLREEARKYGVISNDAADASEAYLDAQTRLQTALNGVTIGLTTGLMPGLTGAITKVADFIASINDWESILTRAGYALVGVTAGLAAFLVVSKGAAVINGIATAFKALTAAIAANPFGAIAVVVTAVLIPALIALYRNWDTVQTYLQQGLARLQYAFKWLGSVIEEGLVVAFNSVKAAGASLLDFIIGNILRGVGTMLEVMGKLPFVGDLFSAASDKVNSLGDAIENMAEETKKASAEAIQAAHEKQNATQAELKNTLASVDAEARARRAAIEEQKNLNEELNEEQQRLNEEQRRLNEEAVQNEADKIEKIEEEEVHVATLAEKLKVISFNEQQTQNQQIEQFQQFLEQRMELEKVKDEEKIEWVKEQRALVLELETFSGEERTALEKAVNNTIFNEDKKLKDAQEKLNQQKLRATADFFSEMSDLAELGAEKNIGLLIVSKAAASAQAAINSYLAFTNALATVPYPFNIAAAAGVLASGIASQIKIISTAIPSAETGGRFVVPNSVGSDNTLMKVNSGEEINVIPRGMTGFNRSQNVIVQIDKEVIFNVVNDGIAGGDILIKATNY